MDNSLKEINSAGGFAAWENRIAPLFDTAGQLVFVGVESGRIVRQSREEIPREAQVQKVLRLVDLGVGTLVCGAISRQLFNMISSYNIQVLPFVAGELTRISHKLDFFVGADLPGAKMRGDFCCVREKAVT